MKTSGVTHNSIICDRTSKQHAVLAGHYLSDGVQSVLRHGYTDVVMQGLRWMGDAGGVLLNKSGPTDMTIVVKEIGLISSAGIVSEKTRPLTVTGVEQLAILTVRLLQSECHDVNFAAEEIKSNVSMLAKILCQLSEQPFASPACSNMAPYYSATTPDSLKSKLTVISNALIKADATDKSVQKIFENIENWADGIYATEKELLLLAVEKRSQFTFDMIHWITDISMLLLALSRAPACPDYLQQDLENHALWLFLTLSWIDDDGEKIAFVERWQMTEKIFEMAYYSRQKECIEFAIESRNMLMQWSFKAGKRQRSEIFEKSRFCRK